MRKTAAILTLFAHSILLNCLYPADAEWDRAAVLLEKYCFTCHDTDSAKGDIVLDGIYDSDGKITDYKLWERAFHSVSTAEMPPKKKKTQPSKTERTELANWIQQALDRSANENAGDPGLVTMRRLTNAEYRHTVRELTGLWKNFAEGFVADGGGGEGFSNTGDVLFISPEQLEKYLRRAREIASHAAILPGTGITFHKQPIGDRGPDLTKSAVEQSLRVWYRHQAEKYMPRDDQDLRESDYLLACWKWKHRNITKAQSLDALAKSGKLETEFLENWWYVLSNPHKSRYLALTTDAFAALPPPDPAKPQTAPATVAKQIKAIEAQRKSWYTITDDWASPQRLQQDADGIRSYTYRIKLNGERKVHLLVSDIGDGNEGDFVHWSELRFQWPDGKWDNLFGWMWRTGKQATDEKTKQWFHQYSRLEMKHPTGKKMAKQTFGVRAPSIVTFPVPEGTIGFSAKGRLERDAPNWEKASVQWKVIAGDRPKQLPAIIPGSMTVWHRLTPAHGKLMYEFDLMKQRFPNNFNKRNEIMETNMFRWDDKPLGAYYLTNKQLFSKVSPEEAKWVELRRIDYGYVARKNMPDDVKGHWDDHMINDLREFADKAWRRPVLPNELETFKKIYFEGRSRELSQEAAAREVLVSILVSPHFLFRIENGSTEKEHLLSQFELAARLSYFLWSCPPDEALIESAKNGKLSNVDWKVICDHVDRMLVNYRSFALAQEFGGQWLGFHDLYGMKHIDQKAFPEFNSGLRHLMYEESWRFFAKIIQESRPVTDLLQAKYTYLNEPLARHYRIPGVTGKEFRYVDVSKHRRGGILGMAAFHAKTSYPVRTSPVLRGDWILKEVLGRPTPPPPPNVPTLEDKGDTPTTLRAQLEKHRKDPTCASCHAKIDPLGFALEKYDPLGRWRESDNQNRPIDDRGKTTNGLNIQGIDGLRQWFKVEEDQFLHHFCTKLAGYALGREIGASDQRLIKEMTANMKKWNYTFGAAVKPLVLSRQFQYRRNQ